MITIRETQGDTLQGAVDGVNRSYLTSYDFYDDIHVNIYVNGRLKVRDWDDGFEVTLPKQVTLKEALLPGDSLEVEYWSGAPTGGGADGGCPCAPETDILYPGAEIDEDVPEVLADAVEPSAFTDVPQLDLISEDMHPEIAVIEEE